MDITLESILNGTMGFKYAGLDNSGKPKKYYLATILGMDKAELLEETERKIWLSAYAHNNPRSDFHWQCDACYEVCKKFDGLYEQAYKKVESGI
jgi:hypothetical protein